MSNDISNSTSGGGGDDCCEKERLSQMMDGEWSGMDLGNSIVGVCGDEALRDKWARYHLVRDAMHHEPVDAKGGLAGRICAAVAREGAYTNVTSLVDSGEIGLPHGVGGDENGKGAGVGSAWSVGSASGSAAHGSAAHGVVTRDKAAEAGGARSSGPLQTFAAGFGLAASVALVTVVGLDAWQDRAGDEVAVRDGATDERGGAVAPPPPEALAQVPLSGQQVAGASLPAVRFVSGTGAYWAAPESSERLSGREEWLNMLMAQHIENSPTAERQGMLPYSRLVGYGERDR